MFSSLLTRRTAPPSNFLDVKSLDSLPECIKISHILHSVSRGLALLVETAETASEKSFMEPVQIFDHQNRKESKNSPTSESAKEDSASLYPFVIVEHMESVGLTAPTLHGLFPTVHCAWATVNSKLYVWDAERGRSDLEAFCSLQLAEKITGVAMLQNPSVQTSARVCVVATQSKVVLASKAREGKLQVVPLAEVDTPRGASLACMAASACGRVFLGGTNGHLYELLYSQGGVHGQSLEVSCRFQSIFSLCGCSEIESEDGVSELSLDEERGLLFARSHSSRTVAFSLSTNGSMAKLLDASVVTAPMAGRSPLKRTFPAVRAAASAAPALSTQWLGDLEDGREVQLVVSAQKEEQVAKRAKKWPPPRRHRPSPSSTSTSTSSECSPSHNGPLFKANIQTIASGVQLCCSGVLALSHLPTATPQQLALHLAGSAASLTVNVGPGIHSSSSRNPLKTLAGLLAGDGHLDALAAFFSSFGRHQAAALCLLLAARASAASRKVRGRAEEIFEREDSLDRSTAVRAVQLSMASLLEPLWNLPLIKSEDFSSLQLKKMSGKVALLEAFLAKRRDNRKGQFSHVLAPTDVQEFVETRRQQGKTSARLECDFPGPASSAGAVANSQRCCCVQEMVDMESMRVLLRRSAMILNLLADLKAAGSHRVMTAMDKSASSTVSECTFEFLVCTMEGQELREKLCDAIHLVKSGGVEEEKEIEIVAYEGGDSDWDSDTDEEIIIGESGRVERIIRRM